MPEAEIKKRGGAKKWRTVSLPGGKYMHVAVVKKKGPRGGTTVSGPVHDKLDWETDRGAADEILKKRGHR